jgi:Sel1 repeat
MAAEASAGTNQRLTLDHSSFEKLLAAAWVLQCLQDQLHNGQVGLDETISQPLKAQKEIATASPISNVAVQPVLQLSPGLTETESKHNSLDARPTNNKILAERTAPPQPVETVTLNFDVAVKIEPETVKSKNSLRSEVIATVDPVNAPRVSLANRTSERNHEWARRGAAFVVRAANLRTAFSRALDEGTNLLPRLRVNLSLRAVRAVAIATPVWLLSLVAALLFLEVWRHESLHSAQATSMATPSAAEVVVGNNPRSSTKTTPAVTEEVKRDENKPRWSRIVPPLEVSHKHITDRATLSAVEQLSRYEIKGLRRQAKYGDESAAFTLGMAYEVGHSVPQNCVEAARWVATAAEADDVAAQYNIGLRYRDGDGVPANRAESEKWLRKAAAGRNRQAKQALKMLASR